MNSVFSSAAAAAAAAAAGSGGGGDRSGGGDAPLGFEVFDEAGDFENRLAGEPLDDLVFGDVAHGIFLLPVPSGLGMRRV